MITSEEIKRRLWTGANDLRGSMDASKYKDYMLGLMFYKFLSDKTLETFCNVSGTKKDSEVLTEYRKAREEYGSQLDKMIQDVLGYYVLPENLYQTWLEDIQSGDFELQKVTDSLNNFERTIAVSGDSDDFKGLFSSSIIDMTNSALGSDLNKRNKNIKDLILLFADLNMVDLQEGDVLGDAYEYLIGQFASDAGKKAGEFYTPHQVSEVMAQIIAKTTVVSSIYDPTVGSGSLLLTVKKHLNKDLQRDLNYYGQEYITETYNLTRMNLLLHGVRPEKMTIKNGNTLAQDWPEDPERPTEGILFDAVVMNPPYSDQKWNKREDKPLKVSDPRFADFGVLPPDSKGDLAYLMHGLYHLGQEGTMAIVLPHGVLFRGSSEGEIRKRLIDKNYIDAIISLPAGMFSNTGIPVCVIILKKNRNLSAPILVIDSSNNFIKVGKQNVLEEKDIAKIVDTYASKNEIEGYSHLATREEIISNDYNMNIPRYVEAIDQEIPQDVDGHLYGGIPLNNISRLTVLNTMVEDLLANSLNEVRPGYVELNKPVLELKEIILNDRRITEFSIEIQRKIEHFIGKYWNILREVNNEEKEIKESMLNEIKESLIDYSNIDIYKGYQIIAEIWKKHLNYDIELISGIGFYEAGRTRKPNIVTKGSGDKKREDQDGWIGAIIPNELIAKRLYSIEVQYIENKKNRVSEVENELTELVEAAKVEDSEEYEALYNAIKKNDEGEPQDTFEAKNIKADLKEVEKNSEEYKFLKKVEKLMSEKTSKNREIKIEEKNLQESIYKKILELTDSEIDALVFEKWFGETVNKFVDLVLTPIREELKILEMLENRYEKTLSMLDVEISELEKSFEKLVSELVVTSDE